jgi:hypothetical protein
MRQPILALAAVAAIVGIGATGPGCASQAPISVDPATVSFTVEKAATLARASHAVSCEAVVTAHTAGVLKGNAFNTAKGLCITADDLLDAADASLAKGDKATASLDVQKALEAVDSAKALTPKVN